MAAEVCTRSGVVMTVGELSRRSGVPVKKLRQYEAMGLIYNQGRSAAGYRLFDHTALWCLEVIGDLRALGLTEAEIQQLGMRHDEDPDQLLGPHLADVLGRVRSRTRARIGELEQLLGQIDAFEDRHRAALAGAAEFDPWGPDPRNAQKVAADRA